jgi:hypothetical protein
MRTVTAFGGELCERDRYSRALDRGVKAAIKRFYILGFGTGLLYLLIYGFYALAFWQVRISVLEFKTVRSWSYAHVIYVIFRQATPKLVPIESN